jgi:hypothetical protein
MADDGLDGGPATQRWFDGLGEAALEAAANSEAIRPLIPRLCRPHRKASGVGVLLV